VVRELVDNALDAGATQVTLRLLAGGVRLISVEDDGHGHPARRASDCASSATPPARSATCRTWRRVATMGFRGEALAAINSIADCAILSRASRPE